MTPHPVYDWILLTWLFLSFVGLLLYHSPKTVLLIGCWLVSWARARMQQRKWHRELYATLKLNRGSMPQQ